MVEHVSASEEKNSNQADGSPQVPVLEEGCKIWCGNGEERDEAEDSGCDGHNFHIIEWPRDWRFLSLRK